MTFKTRLLILIAIALFFYGCYLLQIHGDWFWEKVYNINTEQGVGE